MTDQFGAEIEMGYEATRSATGYFEVTVNGELIHSKKNGDGYMDNHAKLTKVTEAIDKALSSK